MSDQFPAPAPPPGGPPPPRSTPLGGTPGSAPPPPSAAPPGYGQPPVARPQWAQPPQPPQQRGTNGLAIAAFVLALLWLCVIGSVLGIVFGFVALGQIRRSEQRGRGFAIAGIVLGIIGVVATIVIGIIVAFVADDVINAADEVDDIERTSCTIGDDGEAELTLLITNDSSRTSDYSIVVRFRSGGDSVDAELEVEDVAPVADGGTPVEETVRSGEPMAAAGLGCELTFVDRRVSGGNDR